MKDTKKLVLTVIALSILMAGALASVGDNLMPGKVVSKAEIWLPVNTRFGGFALPAGQYLLQHRMVGSDHTMTFVQLRKGNSPLSRTTNKVMPVRTRCTLE